MSVFRHFFAETAAGLIDDFPPPFSGNALLSIRTPPPFSIPKKFGRWVGVIETLFFRLENQAIIPHPTKIFWRRRRRLDLEGGGGGQTEIAAATATHLPPTHSDAQLGGNSTSL